MNSLFRTTLAIAALAAIALAGCQPRDGGDAAAPAEEAVVAEAPKTLKGLENVPSKGAADPKVVIFESSDFQ
jgi:hypothetical protein